MCRVIVRTNSHMLVGGDFCREGEKISAIKQQLVSNQQSKKVSLWYIPAIQQQAEATHPQILRP